MTLGDLRKFAIRQQTRIRFQLANGLECVVTEHGVAEVPGLKHVPDFNLEQELAGAQNFALDALPPGLTHLALHDSETELLNRKRSGATGNGLYVGTLLVSSATLSAIAWRVQYHPELRHPDSHSVPGSRLDDMPWITAVLLAVALVMVVAVPSLNMWPLLVLFLETPIRIVLKRRRTAEAAAA